MVESRWRVMCVNTFAPRNSGRPAGSLISHGEMHFSNTNALQTRSERDSLERDKICMILSVKGYCGSGDKYAAGSSLNCTLCKAGFLSEVGINREEMIEISQASVQKPAVVKIEDTLRIREAILEEAHGLNEISVVRFQCDLTLVLFLRLLCQSIFVLPSFALLSCFIGSCDSIIQEKNAKFWG